MAAIEWLFEFVVDTAALTGGIMLVLFLLYMVGVVIYWVCVYLAVVISLPFMLLFDRAETVGTRCVSLAMISAGALIVAGVFYWAGWL
jgi:hypothetical protein